MKSLITLLFVLFAFGVLSAQQITHLSQYYFNDLVINPAVTGTKDRISYFVHHRSQWMGFKNAPSTQYVGINGVTRHKQWGVGGYLFNDQAGPVRNSGLALTYAYRISTGYKQELSFGLGAQVSQYVVDGNKIELHDSQDRLIDQTVRSSRFMPNFSFGAYYFSKKARAGLSILQLTEPNARLFQPGIDNSVMHMERHYFITGSYDMKYDRYYTFIPSFLLSYVEGNPLQVGLDVRMDYNQKVQAGLGYRSNDAIIFLVGFHQWSQLDINLSYDLQVSKMIRYSAGSFGLTIIAYSSRRK